MPYAKRQKFQTYTAKRFGGFKKVVQFSDEDIKKDKAFYKKNLKILSVEKGNGFYLWKPYIILKTIESLKEDDVLMYCDVDTIFLDDFKPVISTMLKNRLDIMVFDLPNKEYQYSKYNLCEALGLTSQDILTSNQRCASYHLWRKTEFSLNFLNEWLDLCSQYDLICDDVTSYHPDYGDQFIFNLQDQSIFSLLSKKHAITSFRDPSNWGNTMKNEYTNSPYPQLLYNAVSDSRKLWLLTYLLGKNYLAKLK